MVEIMTNWQSLSCLVEEPILVQGASVGIGGGV